MGVRNEGSTVVMCSFSTSDVKFREMCGLKTFWGRSEDSLRILKYLNLKKFSQVSCVTKLFCLSLFFGKSFIDNLRIKLTYVGYAAQLFFSLKSSFQYFPFHWQNWKLRLHLILTGKSIVRRILIYNSSKHRPYLYLDELQTKYPS